MSETTARKSAAQCGVRVLKSRITRYFNDCAGRDVPVTPSGLALALGLRTEELSGGSLPDTHRRLIGQALQRIEAETVELALNGKGGAKGVDAVLQQTAKARSFDAVSALTDEELEARLSRLAREIEEAVGSGKKKGEKPAEKH